ncbi:hypothetical protein [Vibrio europaeus]|nr:hypothetical protein [Vibrio europaeus]MDC5778114.1 hypothetical protein [Vibrio europaeus]MDC5798649.1 hypothetical protein [Vibrio europaeus]
MENGIGLRPSGKRELTPQPQQRNVSYPVIQLSSYPVIQLSSYPVIQLSSYPVIQLSIVLRPFPHPASLESAPK